MIHIFSQAKNSKQALSSFIQLFIHGQTIVYQDILFRQLTPANQVDFIDMSLNKKYFLYL